MNQEGLDQATIERDLSVWDACVKTYEKEIVQGHPDVLAYEQFEEDMLDRLLLYLVRDCTQRVHLVDVGCGSGRLHIRYGLKTINKDSLSAADAERVERARASCSQYVYDAALAGNGAGPALARVGGLDFSSAMIALAEHKMVETGLSSLLNERAWLRTESAFDLAPLDAQPLPVVVTLCNSIGVMQGPQGAQALFTSLRRAVEDAGGIAIISAYRSDAITSHALGNYESTLNVSGQPRWLSPHNYADSEHVMMAREYKRARDPNQSIVVDVFDRSGKLVREGLILTRIAAEVEKTVWTGHIRTWSDYHSHWYPWPTFEAWIQKYWGWDQSWHVQGSQLDALRAEPVQLAIYDPQRRLEGLMRRWKVL